MRGSYRNRCFRKHTLDRRSRVVLGVGENNGDGSGGG